MLFLRDMVRFNGTAVTVNEMVLVKEVAADWNRAPELKGGPLPMLLFAHYCTDLVKKRYTTRESFVD